MKYGNCCGAGHRVNALLLLAAVCAAPAALAQNSSKPMPSASTQANGPAPIEEARPDCQRTGPEWFDTANTPGTRHSPVDLANARLNLVHENWMVSAFSKNVFNKYDAAAGRAAVPLDFAGSYIDNAALVIMHYQVDVFAILFGEKPSPLLDKCNALIRRWRVTGRPVLFPNFFLGEKYEHAPKSNRLISSIVPTGRFRNALPMKGLAIEPGDRLYSCPRGSVFHGTTLDADLRTRGISTLVMAGISSTGVCLSSITWASDADYDVRLVRDCCYDPDQEAHDALFRTGFGGRVEVV